MIVRPPKTDAVEFGDFQTPSSLAKLACRVLAQTATSPASILEPTCGIGNFLVAALEQFPTVSRALGVELNPKYVCQALDRSDVKAHSSKTSICLADFFSTDWYSLLKALPDPILVVGNPPWVTNATLGAMRSDNLPGKSNFQKLAGIEAITGKSNFDISEWMLLRLLELLNGRTGKVAMLCKTSVARKVLTYIWKTGYPSGTSEIHLFDSASTFDVAVDACLLVINIEPNISGQACQIYVRLGEGATRGSWAFRSGVLLADAFAYEKWGHLGGEERYRWRSGLKHDCSKIIELVPAGDKLYNGQNELVDVENECVYPMLKSSDVAGRTPTAFRKKVLVTQKSPGEDTTSLKSRCPKTWSYLLKHAEALDGRASSIYKNRPRFAMFGIGEYTFSPWKVAISGFYKRLQFVPIGNVEGKPIVFDDTVYFISCRDESEANYLASLLNSQQAVEFYSAFIFWDAKRPITVDLLRRLDLLKLARVLGSEKQFQEYSETRTIEQQDGKRKRKITFQRV